MDTTERDLQKNINLRFDVIEARFDQLDELILNLIGTVKKQNETCSKMDDHIDFVECTYETLRSPLDFITTNVNRMRGIEDKTKLPEARKIK